MNLREDYSIEDGITSANGEVKLVPWELHEIPKGIYIRLKDHRMFRAIISGVSDFGPQISVCISPAQLLADYEYTLDRGMPKRWLPCGKPQLIKEEETVTSGRA